MLGDILDELTNPTRADAVLAIVAEPTVRQRITAAAAAEGVEEGALVAARLRHLLDHGGEEMWLDLIGAMANTPQPAKVALERVLAWSFPEPQRVRVTHKTRTGGDAEGSL
ncbi:MAG: hypothetical protein KGK10_08280 [Rhodospirillales bacterium]|nr:hypothetical protein [Rhodospirillales bacterium]